MTTTFLDANDSIRSAVRERLDATPADDPKLVGYLREESCCEGGRCQPKVIVECAARSTHPTSQGFYDLCDALKEMHRGKSTDYGCPSGTDPLANIRNGAKFVGIPAWRAAMVRLSDKVTRLATFNATGSLSYEGVEDNLLDLASYALLSLLLYREERNGRPD